MEIPAKIRIHLRLPHNRLPYPLYAHPRGAIRGGGNALGEHLFEERKRGAAFLPDIRTHREAHVTWCGPLLQGSSPGLGVQA